MTKEAGATDPAAAVAIARWFDLHVDTIHRYVARRAGDEVALDVAAETFRVALEQFDRFDQRRGTELAWLYGIATNVLRRHWRSEQRRLRTHLRSDARTPTSAVDPSIAVDERVDAHRDVERLVDAIDQLDPGDRDLIVLVAVEHLSSAEIAVALGIPASTVRARIRRIRFQLRADGGGPA